MSKLISLASIIFEFSVATILSFVASSVPSPYNPDKIAKGILAKLGSPNIDCSTNFWSYCWNVTFAILSTKSLNITGSTTLVSYSPPSLINFQSTCLVSISGVTLYSTVAVTLSFSNT